MKQESRAIPGAAEPPRFWPLALLAGVALAIAAVALYLPARSLLYAVAGAAGLSAAFVFLVYVPPRTKQAIKFWSMLGLVCILPFQNSLNLLVGFSLRPLTLGLPAFLFLDTLLAYLSWPAPNQSLSAAGRKRGLYLFELAALVLIFWAAVYLPVGMAAGSAGAAYGFLLQFQGLFAYFIVRDLPLSEERTQKLLLAMLLALVFVVGYAFYEYVWAPYRLIDWLVAHSSHSLVQSGQTLGYYRQQLSGANFYRSQSFELEFVSFGYTGFVLSSVLLAVVVLCRRMRRNLWLWAALAASVLGLLSSVTISAIGAFLLAVGLAGWEALRRRGRAKWAFAGLPALAVALAAIGYVAFPQQVQPVLDRVQAISLSNRNQVHTSTYGGFIEETLPQFVLVGRGTGTAGPGSAKYFPVDQYDYFIENEYVGDAAEWGWAGLALYLLFMLSLLRHIVRLTRRYVPGGLGHALGIGLLSVALGYVLIGLYHNVWGQSSIDVQFMILLALWTRGGNLFDARRPGPETLAKDKTG